MQLNVALIFLCMILSEATLFSGYCEKNKYKRNEQEQKQNQQLIKNPAYSCLGLQACCAQNYDDVDILRAYLKQLRFCSNQRSSCSDQKKSELERALCFCLCPSDPSRVQQILNYEACCEQLEIDPVFSPDQLESRVALLIKHFKDKNKEIKKSTDRELLAWAFIHLMLRAGQTKDEVRRALALSDDYDLHLSFEEIIFS